MLRRLGFGDRDVFVLLPLLSSTLVRDKFDFVLHSFLTLLLVLSRLCLVRDTLIFLFAFAYCSRVRILVSSEFRYAFP